ncbi:MAG: DUF305 domain-containing protein, partial [Gammaproteobacteria bacterium]|nr:DUF305 domain-containing protein [Gammaproteobacteria bacterium]
NPQQQFRVTWPAEPVVARAYVDQLQRSGGLSPASLADLVRTLDDAESRLEAGASDGRLAARLGSLAQELAPDAGDAVAARRMTALAQILRGLAARLR